MRIDDSHRPWAVATLAATALLAILYAVYAHLAHRAGGGTPLGLVLGSIALGLMIFEGLLGVRKKFPLWRMGRATTWMRAHLWLGVLTLPVVLLHAAFHAHGMLTWWLMTLTLLVVLSGVAGAWLQHVLPTRMMREVKYETIYDQISNIRAILVTEADENAARLSNALAPGPGVGATVTLTLLDMPELQAEVAEFDRFYREDVRPFVEHERPKTKMVDRNWSATEFQRICGMLPAAGHEPVRAIEEICEEKRQLDHQVGLHRMLHGWLMVHIPLSVALILLACVHAIGALRY
jgi:Ca2+/Na+ antiporter